MPRWSKETIAKPQGAADHRDLDRKQKVDLRTPTEFFA